MLTKAGYFVLSSVSDRISDSLMRVEIAPEVLGPGTLSLNLIAELYQDLQFFIR